MREILFRGKTEKGEWVYGDLLTPDQFGNGYSIADHSIASPGQNVFDVIPGTIGQYTGLTDKNGKKIFEDDIVKTKGKTKYIFCGSSGFCHTNYGEYADTLENVFTVVDCEVIGNKIDNPELLRSDTE